MTRFPLFRRRQIWLPTFLGWLLLGACAAVAGLVSARYIHPFLAPNAPAPGARWLVVEGWMEPGDFEQAVAAFRRGRYDRVITTGGPIDMWPAYRGSPNFADFAAAHLRSHGLADADIVAVPSPASAQDRTYLSAVKVRQWAQQQGGTIPSMDLFSSGTHARRSHMLYRMAFGPAVEVGVLSAWPTEYDPARWWRTTVGVKSVLGEATSVAWTACCFHPGAPGSHEETWGPRREAVPGR